MNTKKKTAIGALLGGLMLALATASFAQQPVDRGVYFGASTGKARYQKTCTGVTVSCEETPFAWRILSGYQFSRNLSVEFGWADLGRAKADGTSGGVQTNFARDVSAFDVSLLGGPSLADNFKVFGRLGFSRSETKLRGAITGTQVDVTEKTTGATFGVGAQYDFTRFIGVRAEWQRFASTGGEKIKPFLSEADKENIDYINLGIVAKF